jgi:hypothetical protein
MFPLLSRVLVWLLIGTVVYSLFQKFYPTGNVTQRFGVIVLFVILALAFVNPNEPAVASLWRVISFPLKPLGASILMLAFAAQKLKDGSIGKPGGTLAATALGILILSSTPAVAYFLVRAPLAMGIETPVATQEAIQRFQIASAVSPSSSTSGNLLALLPATPSVISEVSGDNLLQADGLKGTTVALNPADARVAPYLLQNPNLISRRGLKVEDFVPNAETLSLTTGVWDSYLNSVYGFMRGR